MMKKNYVKPETAVENVMVETMIATSGNNPGGQVPVVPGEGDEFSNDRRGGWGDLWN